MLLSVAKPPPGLAELMMWHDSLLRVGQFLGFFSFPTVGILLSKLLHKSFEELLNMSVEGLAN